MNSLDDSVKSVQFPKRPSKFQDLRKRTHKMSLISKLIIWIVTEKFMSIARSSKFMIVQFVESNNPLFWESGSGHSSSWRSFNSL